jgi:pantoate--beta-alanine ligase
VQVITETSALVTALDDARHSGRQVGVVPTMGALHGGHLSLIRRAVDECDTVAVTIFVNPLQFNDPEDLARYPRDLEADVALAHGAGADLVFAPSVEEMYPGFPEPVATVVHVAGLTDMLEGASRPGHFDGVATVVAKLFALVGRCRAYFGEKDFQQLAVIRQLTSDLSFPVEIVSCSTLREPDGLAMSSRNVRLTGPQRHAARALSRALQAGADALVSGEVRSDHVQAVMLDVLHAEPLVDPDYAVVVDRATLVEPDVAVGDLRLLVAAVVGGVRLIDNRGVQVDPGTLQAPNRARVGGEPTVLVERSEVETLRAGVDGDTPHATSQGAPIIDAGNPKSSHRDQSYRDHRTDRREHHRTRGPVEERVLSRGEER